jgi:hypothetical protein
MLANQYIVQKRYYRTKNKTLYACMFYDIKIIKRCFNYDLLIHYDHVDS